MERTKITKETLKGQLREMGLRPTDTVLIHSSMKAIGEVEGGADAVLDAWMDCMTLPPRNRAWDF